MSKFLIDNLLLSIKNYNPSDILWEKNGNECQRNMKKFLDWLCGKSSESSKLLCGLDAAMQNAKNHEEWRLEYMTLLMRDQEMIQKSREQGLQEGRISVIYELV